MNVKVSHGRSHHGSISNQPHQSVRWDQTQTDDDCVAESLDLVLIQACIDYEEEDGWDLSWSTEGIFYRGEFRHELGGEVGIGYLFVMGWECVSGEAKGTYPKLSANVDLAAPTSVSSVSLPDKYANQ